LKSIQAQSGLSPAERIPKVATQLERMFQEITNNDVANNTGLHDRIVYVTRIHNIAKGITDAAHATRMLNNKIKHGGLTPNDKDYEMAMRAVAECLFEFSGVEIPIEIESIYNSNIKKPIISIVPPIEPSKPISKLTALTIREQDLIENPSPRLPVALLLDCSGSMTIDNRIGELNDGVEMFFNSVLADEITRYSVELSVILFGGTVETILDFANIERQVEEFKKKMPMKVKHTNDGTPMGEAVELGLRLLQKRKDEYKAYAIQFYQPWLVIMTDGQPTDNITNASILTTELVDKKKLSLFPIAIGAGANLQKLGQFSAKRKPLTLKGLNFREFFEWLKESAKSTSLSTPGQSVNLPDIGWATV
jgi:uncharacterized protein YegL